MASKPQSPSDRIEKQAEEQRETQEERASQEMAASEAGRVQIGKTDPAFVDRILKKDITTDDLDDDLDAELVTELSKAHALGNIDDEEYRRKKIEIQAQFERIKPFFPQQEGAGSKFNGEWRDIVRGDESEYPVLTDRLARRIDAAKTVAHSRLSLSREGFLIEALTKIQAVTETNPRDDSSSSSNGRVRSTMSKIGGLLKPG